MVLRRRVTPTIAAIRALFLVPAHFAAPAPLLRRILQIALVAVLLALLVALPLRLEVVYAEIRKRRSDSDDCGAVVGIAHIVAVHRGRQGVR